MIDQVLQFSKKHQNKKAAGKLGGPGMISLYATNYSAKAA
jgi:hypothetical protein